MAGLACDTRRRQCCVSAVSFLSVPHSPSEAGSAQLLSAPTLHRARADSSLLSPHRNLTAWIHFPQDLPAPGNTENTSAPDRRWTFHRSVPGRHAKLSHLLPHDGSLPWMMDSGNIRFPSNKNTSSTCQVSSCYQGLKRALQSLPLVRLTVPRPVHD